METFKKNQNGFTLVEISIVMIIIGLLIGGTFGGMQLVENMQVNKTVQDLKAIQSAALTFKDTYGRLPGDITNPSARIPSCTDAPCATGGNGNRQIGIQTWNQSNVATDEIFTFWHHLQAANLLANADYRNTTTMDFGEGQPSSPMSGGYRIYNWVARGVGPAACITWIYTQGLLITGEASGDGPNGPNAPIIPCKMGESLDRKMDDGAIYGGKMTMGYCGVTFTCGAEYRNSGSGVVIYDFPGF